MKTERLLRTASVLLGTAIASTALGAAQTQGYAVSDAQLQTNVSTALHNDTKLSSIAIIAKAEGGTITLSGSVASEEMRAEAEQVAAGVSGVQSIQDNIDVTGAGAPPNTSPVAANSAPPAPDEPETAQNMGQAGTLPPPPPADSAPARAGSQGYTPYPNGSTAQAQMPGQAQAGDGPQQGGYGQPDFGPRGSAHAPYGAPTLAVSPERQNASGPVIVPPGTLLSVRTTEPLSTSNLHGGEFFQVTAAADVYAQGVLVIPRGAVLTGQVVESKNAGPLGGSPRLDLRLTSLTLGPATVPLATDVWSNQGPSKSGYTASNTIGGAAVGALIGAVAGGGVGAGIGAVAGGATGAVVSGATHGPRLDLPPEALLQFHIEEPLTVQPVSYEEAVRIAASAPQQPVLQARPVYVARPYAPVYVARPYLYAARPYPYYARPYPYGYYYGRY